MAQPQTIHTIAESVLKGEQSAVEAAQVAIGRIRSDDPSFGSVLEVCEAAAMKQAEAVDAHLKRGGAAPTLPLAGAPIAIKDNIVTEFSRTTAGSKMLENYTSPFTATAVQRLLDAGAVIIGKTSCDEFGMGSSGEHCAFGPTRNPWASDRVPGGSSSGSAAAVAAGLCPAALGSDTGGSIRQPASLCGTVGVKPTYGRVSRWGLIAFGSSLEQIGPIACTVSDAALLLGVIAGVDEHDSTTAEEPVDDFQTHLEEPIDNLRLGVPRQYLSENDFAVTQAMSEAIDVFRSHRAEIIEIDMPLLDEALSTYYIIAPAEASSNLARYDGIRYGHRTDPKPGDDLYDLYARSRAEGFGREVQRRIMLGTYVLSAGYYDAYYKRASQARRLIKQEFDEAFNRCHAIIGPTSPVPAFPLGAKTDPLSMYLCDVYTVTANIAGHCAMSLPCGFSENDGTRLPIGLQIQCPAFHEATMLRIARLFERATDFHSQRAPETPKRQEFKSSKS